CTNRLHILGSGAGRFADNVPLVMPPVRGHLASTGTRVILCADGLQEGLERGHAEHEAQRPVAVVGGDPVYPRTYEQGGCRRDAFVAGTRNLKIDFILTFELNFAIVEPPREKHRAVEAD